MNNNIRYQVIMPSLKGSLVDYLLKYFKNQEPITRSLNLTDKDAEIFFKDLVEEGLQYPVSFVAFNENDEIVGCRLNNLYVKDCPNFEPDIRDYPKGPKKIVELLDELLANFQEILNGEKPVEKIMKFVTVSVRSDYQRRGIAQKMIEMSFEKARQTECEFVVATATALKSQKMFEKLGFDCIREIQYANFLDENGEIVFNCDDGTKSSKLMVKKMKY